MTDHTINLIMAIKRSNKRWNQAIAEYMSAYSGSPVEEYGEWDLNRIMKEAFLDYIGTCNNPSMEVRALFDLMSGDGARSLGYYIAMVLGMTEVKENNKYINGFREVI